MPDAIENTVVIDYHSNNIWNSTLDLVKMERSRDTVITFRKRNKYKRGLDDNKLKIRKRQFSTVLFFSF